jgi:hypothetical protein
VLGQRQPWEARAYGRCEEGLAWEGEFSLAGACYMKSGGTAFR